MAPEMLKGESYTASADVYSFAVKNKNKQFLFDRGGA